MISTGNNRASDTVPQNPRRNTPDTERLDRKRLLTAFTLTPLLSGFYPAVFLGEPAVMLLGLMLSYASAVVCGIPLILAFYRYDVRQWWMYVLGGAVCSVPTVVLYAIVSTPEHLLPFGVIPTIGVLFWGASSGIVFWMLGVAGDTPVRLRNLFDPVPREK